MIRLIALLDFRRIDFRFLSVIFLILALFLIPFEIKFAFSYLGAFFSHEHFYGNVYFSIFDLFLLFSFCFYLFSILFDNSFFYKNTKILNTVLLILIFLSVASFFSIIFAIDKYHAFLFSIRSLFLPIFFFLLTQKLIKIKTIVFIFLISFFIQFFLMIYQFFFSASFGLDFLGEPIISTNYYDSAKINVFDVIFLRPYGTFPHPNLLSAYLFCVLFYLLNAGFLKRFWRYFISVFVVFAIFLTFSRLAFFSLLISLTVFLFFSKNLLVFLKTFFVFISAFLMLYIFGIEKIIFERIFDIFGISFSERLIFFSDALNMFIANPFGIGSGNYLLKLNEVLPWNFSYYMNEPVHSYFFLLLAELGVLGAFCVSLLFLTLFQSIFVNSDSGNEAYLKIAALLSLILLSGFDHYFYSYISGQMIFVLFLFFILSNEEF